MLALLGVLAGIGPAISSLPYIRDVLRRKTRPHRPTWFRRWVLPAVRVAPTRAHYPAGNAALAATGARTGWSGPPLLPAEGVGWRWGRCVHTPT